MVRRPICSIVGCIDRIADSEDERIKEEKYYKSYVLRMEIRKAIKDGYTVFACCGDNVYNPQGFLVLLQELGDDNQYKNIVVNPVYENMECTYGDIWTQLETLPTVSVHIGKGYGKTAIFAREKWLRDNGDRIIEIK